MSIDVDFENIKQGIKDAFDCLIKKTPNPELRDTLLETIKKHPLTQEQFQELSTIIDALIISYLCQKTLKKLELVQQLDTLSTAKQIELLEKINNM
jgi:hypothetical protein